MSCPTATSDILCSCTITNLDTFHAVDRATLGYIADQLTDDYLSLSIGCDSAAQLWRKLQDEFGSGKSDQREALIIQLHAQLDMIAFPSRPDKIEHFIGKVDSIVSRCIALGDTTMNGRGLALRIVLKFSDSRVRHDAIAQNLTWTQLKHKLRLIPLLDAPSQQSVEVAGSKNTNTGRRPGNPAPTKCGFCGGWGHAEPVCRKRKRAIESLEAEKPQSPRNLRLLIKARRRHIFPKLDLY